MSNLINTQFLGRIKQMQLPASKKYELISPTDGEIITEVADCKEAEATFALGKALDAFASWKNTTAYERASILKKWHALITENEDLLARLMTAEMGKPILESVGEVRYANSMVEWFAEEAKRVYGETIPSQFAHKRLYAIKQPAGVVFAITPWNFPYAIVTRKIAPALAAGCVVILKPSEQTPLSSLALATLWREAGGPDDVLQVLTTLDPRPVSKVLLQDFRVRVLTFTGSTQR